MAIIKLSPEKWDFPAIPVGDTFPAINFVYEGTGELARVRLKVKSCDGTLALSFDSETAGLTISFTAQGAWDFTLEDIDTAALSVGVYAYDLETTNTAGTVRTLIAGKWKILPQITD